jgi:hypothetical protein
LLSRLLFFALAPALLAHDIPVDVTAQVWIRPSGSVAQMLFRVPLQSVRDVQFPETADGYLDVDRLMPLMPGAAKVTLLDALDLYEGEAKVEGARVVATQVSLASDRSFESFAGALARVRAARPSSGERLHWNQVMLDVLAEAPIRSERSAFAVETRFNHLANRVATSLRFELAGGVSRAYQWTSDPGRVALDPAWTQAARTFVVSGIEHILGGTDHLLFLLCLIIPVRRLRDLVWVVTAFTLAHSVTLIGSAYGWGPQALWFPPLIETLIAASILYMAIENVWRAPVHRWAMAFGFGLIHGFGFSFALHEQLQFAGAHLLLSLLAFNLGVEMGQLAVLLVAVPLLGWVLRRASSERIAVTVLSVLIAHTAWHWMTERWDKLAAFGWPSLDASSLASALRWLMVVMALFGFGWWWRRRERL